MSENVPDILTCLSNLFLLAWFLTTFVVGGYLATYLMKVLVPVIGISGFIVVLSTLTAVLAALFLIGLDKLSSTYKRWSRDGSFLFIQLAVLGFAFTIGKIWITLFRTEALPMEYLLVMLILAPFYVWLVSRKKKGKGKKFSDVDALLKKKD